MARKTTIIAGWLVVLASVTIGIRLFADYHAPRATAERACKKALAKLRVSIQPADQDKYPGQRTPHISARDGSFSHIRGIRPGETGSAEQIYIEDCIADALNPDD